MRPRQQQFEQPQRGVDRRLFGEDQQPLRCQHRVEGVGDPTAGRGEVGNDDADPQFRIGRQFRARPTRSRVQFVIEGRKRGASNASRGRFRSKRGHFTAGRCQHVEQRLLLWRQFVEGIERQCGDGAGQAGVVDPARRVASVEISVRPAAERAAVAVLAKRGVARIDLPAVKQLPRLGSGGRGAAGKQQFRPTVGDDRLPQRRGLGRRQQRRARPAARVVPGTAQPGTPGQYFGCLPYCLPGHDAPSSHLLLQATGETPVRRQHRPSTVDPLICIVLIQLITS